MTVFRRCSNGSKFVTTEATQIISVRVSHGTITTRNAYASTEKRKPKSNRDGTNCFYQKHTQPDVRVFASTQCCFHSLNAQTFLPTTSVGGGEDGEGGADTGRKMRGDKECSFNGVTNYGRVCRKRGARKRGLRCVCFGC